MNIANDMNRIETELERLGLVKHIGDFSVWWTYKYDNATYTAHWWVKRTFLSDFYTVATNLVIANIGGESYVVSSTNEKNRYSCVDYDNIIEKVMELLKQYNELMERLKIMQIDKMFKAVI